MKESPKLFDHAGVVLQQTRPRIGFVRGSLPIDADTLSIVSGTTSDRPIMPNVDQYEYVIFMKETKNRV